MKYIILGIILTLITFTSFHCEHNPESIDWPYPPRKLKPYNSKKAGATIIEHYNISNQISSYNSIYNMSIFEDKLYIYTNRIMYIFDKITFNIIEEININFIYDESKYNSRFLIGNSLFIINNKHGFMSCGYDYRTNIFSINLETGDAILKEKINEIVNTSNQIRNFGYDKVNNYFWIFQTNLNTNFYKFDNMEKKFILVNNIEMIPEETIKKEMIKNHDEYNYINQFTCHSQITLFDGDKCFYLGSLEHFEMGIGMVGILIYSLSDLTESLHFIDIEHLGTLSIPKSLIYDDPYIWIIVERNNQIQMLKLLPNKNEN